MTVLPADVRAAAQDRRGPGGPGITGLLRPLGAKAAGAVLTLAFVVVFDFFLFRILPGDPAKLMLRNSHASAQQIAELRHAWGYDKPLLQQFGDYLDQTAHGDLGVSRSLHAPVTTLIAQAMWPTVLLVGLSTVLATVLGVWLGIHGAWRRGSRFDKVSTTVTNALYAMPTFWFGLVLLVAFAAYFPTGGMHTIDVGGLSPSALIDLAWHLALPTATLTLTYLAEYALIMRSSLLDEMSADYLTTARAKGLRDDQVRRRHAVPNALLPTTTLIFMNLGFVISGAVTVERVYSWPGLGQLSYNAIADVDFPVLQGTFLVFSAGVIIANLVADVLLGVFDPRVRAL